MRDGRRKDARRHVIMRLITKSGVRRAGCPARTISERSPTRPALGAALLPRSRGSRSSRRSASSRAPGSSWPTSRACRKPGDYITAHRGHAAGARAARRGRRAARLPQRLPPPRLAPARTGPASAARRSAASYHGWTYRSRRRADRRARGALDRRARQVAARALPARVEACCGLVFVNLDIHASPAGRAGGRPRERLERYGIERLRAARGRRGSRPTGRSSSTTTSRATTCRSPTPG